ncbi:MAG: sugar O-acyltransferase [Thiotrichaceae bacterium IS1]|nr:MAG: sugar O-acyltransferase [Thiotrichaceae bacterium IS1]
MEKQNKLIIVGDSAFAEIAYEYFTHDSIYEVVAFSVEKDYLTKDKLFGLPIIPLDELDKNFNPSKHFVYVATVYTQLNRLRTRLSFIVKQKGFTLASYISSKSFVWKNAKLGEHCFIFEDNTVQPFVKIGNNVVLWSGNHIGHHSVIQDNCFISSHVVISGFCNIGENCFIGVNATFANNLTIGKDCVIGAGVLVTKDVAEDQVIKGLTSEAKPSARRLFKVKE